MKKQLIWVATQMDLKYAIELLEESGFSIDANTKRQFMESWRVIDAVYGDTFSKTISALIDGQDRIEGYEEIVYL